MTDLFDEIQSLGTKLSQKHRDLDYLKILDELSDQLGAYGDTLVGPWNKELSQDGTLYFTFTRKVLELPEFIISGFGHKEAIDRNHFIIQIFRIPLQEEPTLFNLLRVSFYCGLLLHGLKSQDFPEGIVKAFKGLKVNELVNFVTRQNYQEAVEKIPTDDASQLIRDLACAAK